MTLSNTPVTTHKTEIEGEVGVIEINLDLPADINLEDDSNLDQVPAIAVACHPHPLHGGAMTNKVIHTVSRAIAASGIPSARFNFRGVGKSAGTFDHGIGEGRDLEQVIDWMKNRFRNQRLLLAGFSFGAFVSSMNARKYSAAGLISVAPPVKRFDFSEFQHPYCDWLVVMGDDDEVVSADAVYQWVDELNPTPQLYRMEGAGHFFHGRLVELRESVEPFLEDWLQKN